jgi:hypothetical protein
MHSVKKETRVIIGLLLLGLLVIQEPLAVGG